jgi:hypothetical protein
VNDELQHAWARALAGPWEDVAPWRVLADMLLSSGDPRGELMQLHLDAEQGPLTGMARIRAQRLAEELLPRLVPPGVRPGRAVIARAVPVECLLRPVHAEQPAHPAWLTVRRLVFDPYRQPIDLQVWAHTPLAGGRLASVERVDHVAEEVLSLLHTAPVLPRLRRLGVLGIVGRPGHRLTNWERTWAEVLPRHPRLRELELGWTGSPEEAWARLEALTPFPLERVTCEVGPMELVELHAWAGSRRPRFVLEARLRQESLGAYVELHADQLVLRARPGQHAEAEASIRRNWPAHRAMPPLRTVS